VSRGPVWGVESDDLNATILAWPAGEGPPEHVNDSRDVLYVGLEGSASLVVDGKEQQLAPGVALIVPKGARRGLVAGGEGVRYLTAHVRRGPLQIRASR
jgi:quercetin dioxygenase-like cupin family protein